MRSASLLLLLLLGISLPGFAQLGGIKGRITNQTNQPLQAAIQLKRGSQLVQSTTSDKRGEYQFNSLAVGNYTISVACAGYKSATKVGIPVLKNGVQTANFVLRSKVPYTIVTQQETDDRQLENEVAPSLLTTQQGIILKPTNRKDEAIVRRMGEDLAMKKEVMRHYAPNEQPVVHRYYNPSEENYKRTEENDFRNVASNPVSTMSVDVDRASYSNVRRFINAGQRPPVDAVRVEEMINYFDYDYEQPEGKEPIAISTEITPCPWQAGHKLLRVGMQALKVNTDHLPASNLVFLIDVSGSMESGDKLPLLIAGMKLLVKQLRSEDKIAIVTYAGSAGLVLPPTTGNKKDIIYAALDRLRAGGSTAGGAGIELAYRVASENFVAGGNNRIILATDGDFNVGVNSDNELEAMIIKKRASGIFLTCLGFGTGNYKDAKMEMLADKGNGNYSYIDNLQEAQKTLVSEFGGTLFTVAKDVKAQIELNPALVKGYRLVGYENRMLQTEDFKDDKKDAGDMGSGHTVTLLYELIPNGTDSKYIRDVNELKYQKPRKEDREYAHELATIKFRYKRPDGNVSNEMTVPIANRTIPIERATENTRFATAVALFGMLLRESKYTGSATVADVIALAEHSKQHDKEGYRSEFVRLTKTYTGIINTAPTE